MNERMQAMNIRREELMEPIHRQIMMTDDVNDVVLLATNMFTTSMLIFYQNYGDSASDLIETLAADAKTKFGAIAKR
ncbi:hypothetical protein UFOVP245_208 [uncultured Caudovirales phage]|uniref:Uncharacterized protein n=1 Tax=uncultured Caudovirales phage TaxID=2100421 RepID=A0A6J7WUG2_9CAUD|nr:hypothetical protein UFOVP245_208 [uncultured Caudovirales phage]